MVWGHHEVGGASHHEARELKQVLHKGTRRVVVLKPLAEGVIAPFETAVPAPVLRPRLIVGVGDDGVDGGELVGIAGRQMEGARAAHGGTRQVDAVRVDVEIALHLLNDVHHIHLAEVLVVGGAAPLRGEAEDAAVVRGRVPLERRIPPMPMHGNHQRPWERGVIHRGNRQRIGLHRLVYLRDIGTETASLLLLDFT